MSADNEPLGYKKPPSWSRFQKGKSGNPRGRPRKSKAETAEPIGSSQLDDALRKERERTVRVNDANGITDLTLTEVILRSMMNSAAKGDIRAQREALKWLAELEVRDAERQKAVEEQKKRTFKLICDWKAAQAKNWAAAEKRGVEPDKPWPHPDDILINTNNETWRVRGPYDDKDVPYYAYCRAERDALFARLVLEARSAENGQMPRSASKVWICWDVKLPQRWKIMPWFEVEWYKLEALRLKALGAHVEACERRANELRPASFRGPMDKKTYRALNIAMKPLLRPHGYRSFAEFESAYNKFGEAMPWPKPS